jgi:basic amino acid/polyamine antiporter, APA family
MSSHLRRDLGLFDSVGVGLGAIIGAGIFVVTGVAAGIAGPSFLVGLLLAGIAATCNALSSAQLAATYPQAGGTYEYGYRVLHPWAGFAAGWMFLASKLAAGGTVALGFAGYLSQLFPGLPLRPTAVGTVALLTFLNLFGIRKAGRLNTAIVAVSLLALLYFVAAGIPAFNTQNLQPFAPHGTAGILQAAALLFFAYTGYARIVTLGEEVRDPTRTIPRAIIISLSIAGLLYLAVALVAVGAVGAEAMASTRAPLERSAQAFSTPSVVLMVGVGATTAMLGVLLSQVMGISRMMFAMARRRDLPAPLDHIHPSNGVPDRAVLLTGLIISLLALFGTLDWIVAAASFTILVYYGIANVAALRMPAADKRFPDAVPALGLLLCILLAFSLRLETILSGLVLCAVGFLFRYIVRTTVARASRP